MSNVLIGQCEGLPNITGNMGWTSYGYVTPNGAFFKNKESSADRDNYSEGFEGIGFDAALGETKIDGTYKNDVYGKSDHLQTNNIILRYWKRMA